jgi:hypothetical protein
MDKEEGQEQQAEEQPKAKPPDPRLPVRLVAHKDGSALVEWLDEAGMYRRVYVPLEKVDKGTVASKDLAKGIPHGLPWEEWIEVTATPEYIANELRRHGCWCHEDLNHIVLTAVNKAFDQGEFIKLVNQEANQ